MGPITSPSSPASASRRARWGLAVALIVVVGLTAVPTVGAAQAPRSGDRAAAKGASPSAQITFFFGLRRPEAAARAAFFAVQRPGSASYRRFLTPAQVSARYGASVATRAAFTRDIAGLGLSARIDPSGVFARVSGSVAAFQRAFKVRIVSVFGNDPNVLTYSVKGSGRLPLPASLRPLVSDVVATYARSATPSGQPAGALRGAVGKLKPPRRSGRWTRGCAAARKTGGFSFAQVRHAYGIDRLGSGKGASVAILNVGEGLVGSDIAANARCFGYPKLQVRTLRSDGQTRAFGRGTFEPEEDLAVVRGIAPGLTSLELSQVWLSPELWFLGVSQVLDAGHLPGSLSISYGECERSIRGRGSTPNTRAGADLMDSLLVRLGLAGVGAYAASGDFGSTCDGQPFSGVAWPASSPFLTSVGGTRLTLGRDNQRTGEVAWNDLRWLSVSDGGGASGGGYSIASPRPPFQSGLGLAGNRRAVPDVSAVASNFPGWPVVLDGHWVIDGGTSGSTPLVASAMAILSAGQQRLRRPPIGPANGLFYALARQHASSFWDIVQGDNRYLPRVRSFQAKRGYDLVSGLGVPQFAALAAQLPVPAR